MKDEKLYAERDHRALKPRYSGDISAMTAEDLREKGDILDKLVRREEGGDDMSKLREAARAVVDQWDTPNWNLDMHTGVLIDRLRAALAQPETAEPVVSHQQRAIEFGGYLATDAERLVDAINELQTAEMHHEEPESEESDDAVYDARESLGESMSAVRSAVYEFRKRADRAKKEAHPPRDEWRPASERPTGAHDVEINVIVTGHYDDIAGCWRDTECALIEQGRVIGWRDVQPPTEGER